MSKISFPPANPHILVESANLSYSKSCPDFISKTLYKLVLKSCYLAPQCGKTRKSVYSCNESDGDKRAYARLQQNTLRSANEVVAKTLEAAQWEVVIEGEMEGIQTGNAPV
jgi:hypothetical protein